MVQAKLKQRLAGNFFANLLAQGTTVLVQLATVPLFLTCWGKERYGEWLIISAIPSYLSLADAGFATFSANEVSMLISKGDREGARRSLHTAWGFLLGVSILILVLAGVALLVLPWQDWLNIAVTGHRDAQLAALTLCAYSVLGLLLGIYGTIYRGAYQNARGVNIGNAGRILELVVMTLAVYFSHSVVILSGAMLTARAITMLVVHLDSDRLAGGLVECGITRRPPSASTVKPTTASASMAASPCAPMPASAAARSAAIFSRAVGEGDVAGSPR